MQEKTIPHSIEAEQAVLGSMFLTKYALQKGIESFNDCKSRIKKKKLVKHNWWY